MKLRMSTATLLWAATVVAFACPASAQIMTVDIPAEDLRVALDDYIKLTNVQLVYKVDDLNGLRSRAVRGPMDINVALDQLLEGTGIAVHRDPSGAIVVSHQLKRGLDPPELEAAVTKPAGESFESIIVTGYRASLEKALYLKRESVGVRDSILAEDIGKYPANNVAESLMRVPGVVIVRDTRTDEGKSVTMRGLDASYTIVTINGNPVRTVTGTSVGNNNRSVDLDAFGADIFSRVDFYKSPQAGLSEGGIGGVIDMRTPHPFDYDEMKASYSLGYTLNTYRNKAMPRGSFQVSNTLGPFGALLAFTVSEAAYQLMGSEVAGWGQSRNDVGTNIIATTFDFGPSNGGFDPRANIGGSTIDQVQQAFLPRFISRQHLELEDRTRYSGDLSLQYRPSDRADITFDLLAAKLIDKRSEYTLGPYFRSTLTTASGWAACQADPTLKGTLGCSGIVPLNAVVDGNNELYGTFGNMGWVDENRWYDGDDKYISGTINAKVALADNFTLNGVASIGDNRSFYSDNRIYFYMLNTTVTYDPTVNYKFPQVSTATDMTDVSRYTMPSVDANYYKEGDRVITGRLNGEYAFQTPLAPLDHINLEFGASWVSSQKTNDRKSNGAAVKTDGMVGGRSFAAMALSQYTVNHIPITNFLDGIDHAPRVMNWATVPRSFYQSLNPNGILTRQDSIFSSVFNVTEAVESAFVQADTDGKLFDRSLRINAGVRYAVTRLWGYNYGSSKNSAGRTIYTPTRLQNKYNDLLPTLSIAYDAFDDFVLRAAYGKTITRPSLGSIAQGTAIPTRFNAQASSGNPELLPLKAQNIDLGAEWYFAPESLLSLGVYYKDLKNLISTQTENVPFGSLNLPWSSLDPGVFGTTENPNLSMQLSHPVNLNPMVVKGFEVFYQQSLSFLPDPLDGLGTLLSFTYTAGAAGGPGTGFMANDGTAYKKQITGLSTYTLNSTAFYEKGPYNVRISYSWHSATPAEDGNHNNTDLRLWNQARGSLDATIGYQINDLVEVRLDATNLLDAPEYEYVSDGTQGHAALSAVKDVARANLDYMHGSTFTFSIHGRL